MAFAGIIDVFLHLDKYLTTFVTTYGIWTYLFLFLTVFFETGLVVTAFLPGDSLLFGAGILAVAGGLNIVSLLLLFTVAAILGDSMNYWIGTLAGPRIFRKKTGTFFNHDHLMRTEGFYERHGGKTVMLARFVPIIRTFAPFVAGIARMRYASFLFYNVVGAILWVLVFTLGGFFFGQLPFVVDHFSIVVLIIIAISFIPFLLEVVSVRKQKKGN